MNSLTEKEVKMDETNVKPCCECKYAEFTRDGKLASYAKCGVNNKDLSTVRTDECGTKWWREKPQVKMGFFRRILAQF